METFKLPEVLVLKVEPLRPVYLPFIAWKGYNFFFGQDLEKVAKELFDEALNLIITKRNAEAKAKLTEVIRYATEAIGFEEKFVHKLSSSRLLLISQLLCAMYDMYNKQIIQFL